MGDRTKEAIVIVTDPSPSTLSWAGDAASSLSIEGYTVTAIGPVPPQGFVDAYIGSNDPAFDRLLSDLQKTRTPQDEIVVVVAGTGKGLSIASRVADSTSFSKRVVIVNQPAADDDAWTKMFFHGQDTLMLFSGSTTFTSDFWRLPVSDSWQQHFAAAVPPIAGPYAVFPRYLASHESYERTSPPFPATVNHVTNRADLDRELRRLQPGQFAIMEFSSLGCPSCPAYESFFTTLPSQAGGRYLFLSTWDEDLSVSMGVTVFPQVHRIDAWGNTCEIRETYGALDHVGSCDLPPAQQLKRLRPFLIDSDQRRLDSTAWAYSWFSSQAKPGEIRDEAPALRLLFNHPQGARAIYCYGEASQKWAPSEQQRGRAALREHFTDFNVDAAVWSLIASRKIPTPPTLAEAIQTDRALFTLVDPPLWLRSWQWMSGENPSDRLSHAILTWGELAAHLQAATIKARLPTLRSLLHTGSRYEVITAYRHLGRYFPPSQLADDVREILSYWPESWERTRVIIAETIKDLAPYLSPASAHSVLAVFKSALQTTNDSELRAKLNAAIMACTDIF